MKNHNNGYTGEKINILGFFTAYFNFTDINCKFDIFVLENGGSNLLGKDFLKNYIIKLTHNNVLNTVRSIEI